jgi:hypothetical protein
MEAVLNMMECKGYVKLEAWQNRDQDFSSKWPSVI